MDNLEKICLSTYFLCCFKDLKEDKIFSNFVKLLENLQTDNLKQTLLSYCDFTYCLKNSNCDDFSKYLDEKLAKINPNFEINQIEKELKIISAISKIQKEDIKNFLCKKYPNNQDMFENLADFKNSEIKICANDFKENKSFKNIRTFIFDNNFEIRPIETSEKLSFHDLKGYQEQKRVLYENTKSFLEGNKVNNILLYGDAGCGKSSSVRALLNEFSELKIIQIFKNNLINLDKLYLKLQNLPHKFIIFADDISFDEDDNIFSTMKAIIEGSLIQCPKNAVIYATSNRRHLVKETFKSRSGDEIHLKDTINELNSLSERFGINLFFSQPTNDEFNKIVLELAKDNKIELEEKVIIEKAQRLALIKGSKSPRIAKQLIDNLVAKVDI